MKIDLPYEPKRILIVKPSALGDIVHTLPILHLLRKRFPAAEISWLVMPAFASILEGNPDLDHIILFERKRLANLWRDPSAAKSLFQFARDLKEKKFDMVIDLQGLFRTGWIAWQTNAPIRIGFSYAREAAPLFYTHRVPTDTHEKHAIERYLDITEALGAGRGPVEFDFAITEEHRKSIQQKLGSIGVYAVLFPGTNWPTKRWSAERFESLIPQLQNRFGLQSVVAGAKDVTEMPQKWEGALNLANKTTVKELVALIEGASLVISHDSAPMHIASALNRPLVSIIGPTNPVRTGPYNRLDTVTRLQVSCSPCYKRTCNHHSCMYWLEAHRVVNDIEKALAHTHKA